MSGIGATRNFSGDRKK